MSAISYFRTATLACVLLAVGAIQAHASAFVRGAYYRLGDDDPGAVVGQTGNDPTRDSFADQLHLTRIEAPRYSADVPPLGPRPNGFSMAFASSGLGEPRSPGYYGRTASIGMDQQGLALEAWVKPGSDAFPVPPGTLDPNTQWLIAYNGDPNANGFGLFMHGPNMVARIATSSGIVERTIAPTELDEWHHVAYVHSLGTSSYFYDGKLVRESTTDPAPLAASGGFWIGGNAHPLIDPGEHLFNGWIDEVRYQSFNPLAAGSFSPTDFLISDVPEPTTLAGAMFIVLIALRRRS